jgi:hypothetical protein
MANSTDISKLYSLMDQDPGKYKEMMCNEQQVRLAMRNWPLVRAMALPSVEIPPVTVGENFDTGATVQKINNSVNERVNKNTEPAKLNKKRVPVHVETMATVTTCTADSCAPDIEDEIQISNPIAAIHTLKSIVASEVIDTSFAVKTANIVDLAKWNVQETVKTPTQGKPLSAGQKLTSLFSRLEEGHRPDHKNVNILKLGRS